MTHGNAHAATTIYNLRLEVATLRLQLAQAQVTNELAAAGTKSATANLVTGSRDSRENH